MKLMTKAQRTLLVRQNAMNLERINDDGNTIDFKPVIKLFNPCGAATWLISELDPDTNTMFGLCYLGQGLGEPSLGYVSLDELEDYTNAWGLGIERDIHWVAEKKLSEYASEARARGTINV